MATSFAFPALPPSVSALPFLFMRSRADDRDWDFNAALASAIAGERADTSRRNTRSRIAYLLCELGYQYGRRIGDFSQEMPLCRAELARCLDISLCRVKRILALLSLSGAIATDGASIRIIDWRRLASVAAYDCARLGIEFPDDDYLLVTEREEGPANLLTASGDPACFV